MKPLRILLAAAGTAGHIEPALAVGRWLSDKKVDGRDIKCEFIGTSAALDSSLLNESGFTLHSITKAPFPRKVSIQAILWPLRFTRSLLQIWRVSKGSDLIIGFGGYVCAPSYLLSKIRGIPLLIHEANVKPGMANELGRRLGAKVAIAFRGTSTLSPLWAKAELVGMPLRASVKSLVGISEDNRELIRSQMASEWSFDPDRPIVLVFGGSQGSQAINNVIEEILPQTELVGIQIVHGVGRDNPLLPRRKNYLPTHYISDMARAMVACDFAITRGGAVTCAELGVLQTFAVIIPLALGNGEQRYNAQELSQSGAAVVVEHSDFNAKYLSDHFIGFVKQAGDFRKSDRTPLFKVNAEELFGEMALHILKEVNS